MAYSDKVIDHYNNPRNVGQLDKSSTEVGTGLVGDDLAALGDLHNVALAEHALDLFEVVAKVADGCGLHVIHFSITLEPMQVRQRFIAVSSPFFAKIGYAVLATWRLPAWTLKKN